MGIKSLNLLFAGVLAVAGYFLVPGDAHAEPGDTFHDCERCPLMVEIPPGSFMMGSPSSEKGRDSNEGPVHRVRIAYSFAVGVFEIRFADWDVCVAAGGCGGYKPRTGIGIRALECMAAGLCGYKPEGDWGRGRQPVIHVSWHDAQEYVKWLSAKTGHAYRLLSESEWEYAARAGTTTPFHTGRTISTQQANYDGNYTYGSGVKGVYRDRTVAVGSFPPNAFGLHDMHGNVDEWVQDCWNDNYQGAPVDGSAWESWEMDCSRRVLRGGSWFYSPGDLRSADRSGDPAGIRDSYVGFRVARTLTP